MRRAAILFAVFFVIVLLIPVPVLAKDVPVDDDTGGRAGREAPADTRPEGVADSFFEIYTKWVKPVQEAGAAIVLLVLTVVTFSALAGGGVERLRAVKGYLVFAAVALFLIWNAYPLALWLWDLFLK